MLRAATPERLSAFSDAVFAVLITVLVKTRCGLPSTGTRAAKPGVPSFKEPLAVILPADHRLAALKAIRPQDLVGETFVNVSNTAPVLRGVIDDYLKRSRVKIRSAHEADHLAMGISLVASTRGVGLLPAYAENFLPSAITSRPLQDVAPNIDLVFGYNKANQSPVLKLLLSRLDELVARVSKKVR